MAVLRCGVCGGGVRMYEGILSNRPIRDWKHTDAPEGTAPHRPILGHPVEESSLQNIRELRRAAMADKEDKQEAREEPPAPPIWAPRPAGPEEIPRPATGSWELALAYGWEVEHPTYFRTAREFDYCVLRGRRADLGFVAVWENRGKGWKFEDAWALAGRTFERVGSKSLKDWITSRDERCAACGRSSKTHDDEECDA